MKKQKTKLTPREARALGWALSVAPWRYGRELLGDGEIVNLGAKLKRRAGR